jgi:hypothetical protein
MTGSAGKERFGALYTGIFPTNGIGRMGLGPGRIASIAADIETYGNFMVPQSPDAPTN